MKKLIGIFISILIISTIIPVSIDATNSYDPLDGGWIEERNGITILHVSGMPYVMGYQHGYLFKDLIMDNCVFFNVFMMNVKYILGISK